MLVAAQPTAETLSRLPADLQLWVAQLLQSHQTQAQEIVALRQETQLLHQKLEALIRRYFGSPKNEALDPRQLQLLLAGLVNLEVAPPPAPPKSPPPPARRTTPRPPARAGIPENLPIQREVLLPAEVQAQPEAFRQIDELVTRELDYEPGRFFWHLIVRPKFVRKACGQAASAAESAPARVSPVVLAMVAAEVPELKEVLVAALPNRLIDKGLPGVGLLVHLILSRFEDHLPFYRLEKIFRERHHVPIARQSMVEWTEQVATWLQPVYRQMLKDLVAQTYLQADETPIWYLDREVPGRACRGYFWVYGRPGGDVIFDWQTGRGREGPRVVLKDFKGRLQVDGYRAYQSLAAERKADLVLIACWAHARRKFHEAKDHDRRAGWFLKQIALLYRLESRCRERRAGPALRQAARAAEAKMILERLGRALQRLRPKVLPGSLLGKAMNYAWGLWTELNRYVEFGEVEIDNNLIENAIRPTAIGKKNFLFIGHPEAGWRSAVLYSILGSCRRHGINPAEYLRDVLKRLPDMKQSDIPTITPGAWAKAHPQARNRPLK